MIIIYLIPYILLFVMGMIIDQKRSIRLYWLFIIVLALFSGLRYDVGYDYQSYVGKIDKDTVFSLEPINVWILSLCNTLNSIQLFFMIHSFVTLFTMGVAIKKISIRPSLSIILFIGFPLLFLSSMSVVRFWTALSLVFLASIYLFKGSIIKYLLFMIIAVGFHTSAISGLLFLLIKYINISYYLNWIMIVASYAIGFVSKEILSGMEYGSNIFMQRFFGYVNREEMAGGFTIIPYIFLGIDILFLLYYKRISRVFGNAGVYISIFNIGCCIMFIMSFNTTLSMRLSRYFTLYLLVIIPYIVAALGKKSLFGNKEIWIIMTLFFYIYQLCIFNESLMKYEFLPYNLCINVF